jgi:hypothetical protein
MPRRSREERIELLAQQEKAIQAKKRELLAQENTKKRRERTRRLIRIGAIAVKFFKLPDDAKPDDFEQYLQDTFSDKKET